MARVLLYQEPPLKLTLDSNRNYREWKSISDRQTSVEWVCNNGKHSLRSTYSVLCNSKWNRRSSKSTLIRNLSRSAVTFVISFFMPSLDPVGFCFKFTGTTLRFVVNKDVQMDGYTLRGMREGSINNAEDEWKLRAIICFALIDKRTPPTH